MKTTTSTIVCLLFLIACIETDPSGGNQTISDRNNKAVTSALIGVRNIQQLKENVASLKKLDFSKSELSCAAIIYVGKFCAHKMT